MTLARTVPERTRKRLYRRFRTRVDGLMDKALRRAEVEQEEEREPMFGQWQKTHRRSFELEIVERMEGTPQHILSRAVSAVYKREIVSVALVAIDRDGVIHSAWSDGDLEVLGKAAGFLSDDLAKASQ
jgi:hypothetical protein